jgi:hypothetical protein
MRYSILRCACRAAQTSIEIALKQTTISEFKTYLNCARGHYMFVREETLKSHEPLMIQMTWALRKKLRNATISYVEKLIQ